MESVSERFRSSEDKTGFWPQTTSFFMAFLFYRMCNQSVICMVGVEEIYAIPASVQPQLGNYEAGRKMSCS